MRRNVVADLVDFVHNASTARCSGNAALKVGGHMGKGVVQRVCMS